MIQYRPILKTALLSVVLLTVFSFNHTVFAQNGQKLFQDNCASCHAVHKKSTGPALAGVEDRWPDQKMLYKWIKNSTAVIQSGYPYAVNLFNEYNKVAMNQFPSFSDADVKAILDYVKTVPNPADDPGSGATAAAAEKSDNSLLYGVLTLILAIVALLLLQVNSNLRKLSDEQEGIRSGDPIPFYKNKAYIMLTTLVLFIVGGFFVVKGAIGLGRSKDYQPEQPIYYSHKVHAGVNQVNCLYCHGGAQEGKHANIPSVNVCMNCHTAINEYAGKEKFYKEDGTEINGTAEIQKLYEYAGYDVKTGKYDTTKQLPIQWVKIHNLPDHVYFNHSQHVKAGKVACQTCHGPIQEMNEVYQFSDLSMGWCINCHRESKVDFNDDKGGGNQFYSIYEKYHNDLKSGKLDKAKGVTVEMIGGTECQKCHY
jgi:cytochrome c2